MSLRRNKRHHKSRKETCNGKSSRNTSSILHFGLDPTPANLKVSAVSEGVVKGGGVNEKFEKSVAFVGSSPFPEDEFPPLGLKLLNLPLQLY